MSTSSTKWARDFKENDPAGYKLYMKQKYEKRVNAINSDPLTYAKNKFAKQRSGANRRGLAWNLSLGQVTKLVTETKHCSISGRPLVLEINHPDSPSLDRIDNRYGYSAKNVQVVSAELNKARLDLSVDDFVKMCVDVARHFGHVK